LEGSTNDILDEELRLSKRIPIFQIPTVLINGKVYTGTMHCPKPMSTTSCRILAVICSIFSPENPPQVCIEHHEIGCAVGERRDFCGVCGGDATSCTFVKSKYIEIGFTVVIAIIISISCMTAYYLKWRFTRAEEQFSALRNMYQPLSGSERNGGAIYCHNVEYDESVELWDFQ